MKIEDQIFKEYCADRVISVIDSVNHKDDIKNTFDFQRYRFRVRWREFINCLVKYNKKAS